jgi:hypothetical protein
MYTPLRALTLHLTSIILCLTLSFFTIKRLHQRQKEQYDSALSETRLENKAKVEKYLTRTERSSLGLLHKRIRYLETKKQIFEEKMFAKDQEYKLLKASYRYCEKDISQGNSENYKLSTKLETMERRMREIDQSERCMTHVAEFSKLQVRINGAIALSSKYQKATNRAQSELDEILEASSRGVQNQKEAESEKTSKKQQAGARPYVEPRATRDPCEELRRRYAIKSVNSKHAETLRELADLRNALEKEGSKVRGLELTLAQRDAYHQQQIAEKENESQERFRDMWARFKRARGSKQKRYSANGMRSKGSKASTHEDLWAAHAKAMWLNQESLEAKYESSRSEYNTLKGTYENSQLEYRTLQETYENSLVEFRALKEAYDALQVEYRALKEACDNSQSECRTLKETCDKSQSKYNALNEAYDRSQLKYRSLKERLDNSQLEFENQQRHEKGNLQKTIEDAESAINARDQMIVELEAALRKKTEELNQSQLEVELGKELARSAIETEKGKKEEFEKKLLSYEGKSNIPP